MSSRRPRKVMAQMNVVPYIDVMLVLLVIFMVTAPMMKTGVQVDTPEAQAAELPSDNKQEPLIISVNKEGHIFLDDGSEVAADRVSEYIKSHMGPNGERPVYIQADKSVEYRYVMNAMAAAQQAGAKKMSMVGDQAPPPKR